VANILIELKKFSKQKKIQKLQRAITQAEKAGQDDELAKLMDELKNLTIS
jgi:hypothetical protein